MQGAPKFGQRLDHPTVQQVQEALAKWKEFLTRQKHTKESVRVLALGRELVEISKTLKGMDSVCVANRHFLKYEEAFFQICKGKLHSEFTIKEIFDASGLTLRDFYFHNAMRRKGNSFRVTRAQAENAIKESDEPAKKSKADEVKIVNYEDFVDFEIGTVSVVGLSAMINLKITTPDLNI